jgi:NhaA family Na+:H+ antiporter
LPTATDLAVAGSAPVCRPPCAPFLLTLAVVDDLLAITVIAIFYTSSLRLIPLALTLVPLALFGLLVQRRVRCWWLQLPLALLTWGLGHASGIHATVAGVLLAFTVPVIRRKQGPARGLAEHFEHRWRPLSAGVVVPVFAFFAAGVSVAGELGEPARPGSRRHRRRAGGRSGHRDHRRDLAGATLHPGSAGRRAELVGRAGQYTKRGEWRCRAGDIG